MSRKTVILSLIYVIFIVLAFFYVKSILRTESLFPKDNTKPKIEKTWDVSATLVVNTGTNTLTYKATVKDTDTVMGFLEELRNRKGLVFEKVDYAHGTEIDTLFSNKAPDGYKWVVFLNETDMTSFLSSARIVDGATYEIKLAPK